MLDAGPLNSSLELGMMCDRFGIKRVLAASALDGKHTLTSDAERHIGLLKVTMLKMHADIVEAGLPVDYDMIAAESSCAHNCLLTHHGVTPSLGFFGNIPRKLYEIDNESQDAVKANLP